MRYITAVMALFSTIIVRAQDYDSPRTTQIDRDDARSGIVAYPTQEEALRFGHAPSRYLRPIGEWQEGSSELGRTFTGEFNMPFAWIDRELFLYVGPCGSGYEVTVNGRRAYDAARSESLSSFGDDTVYLEKFVEEPHHIEFQILGDSFGNVVHLFDRECSVQRRNQKIVEESPSPFLTPELRREMGEKAVAAAKAVGYRGTGTIEFLVDKYRHFYFLEMNTRLQVEHPITEEVMGVDLVKEQIRVAGGEPLRFRQDELFQRGHAIECRICAEDTENGFMPCPGVIRQLIEPNGIGVRIDSYVYEGYEIPIYYDPMIGKLIVWAVTRQYAIERMRRVLYEFKITGLKTNISYLRRIMYAPAFVKGEYDTSFLEKYSRSLQRQNGDNEEMENMAMIAAYVDYLFNLDENKPVRTADQRPISRWREFGLQKGVLRI